MISKNYIKLSAIIIVLITRAFLQPLFAQDADIADGDRFSVDYSAKAKDLTIADIKITGADSYEDYVLIGFSGLNVGDVIRIPGNDITSAIKRFWKQGYFSDVKILMDDVKNDSVWLTIALKQLPRVTKVNFFGLKKSEIEDISEVIEVQEGKQLNADAIDRSKIAISKYLHEKGFYNADILMYQKNDTRMVGGVMVDISVDKREKVKVNDIIVIGNDALSIGAIDRVMKKTNRRGNLLNIFRAKKFVAKEYKNDKDLLIGKYNEIGYRDAKIVRDSVVMLNDGQVNVYLEVDEGEKYYFGNIDWLGNTLYSKEYLNAVLNIEKGSVYNQKIMNKRLFEDEDALSSLYKDNGYLFMQLDPVEVGVNGDSINLEMRIYEGTAATINKVVINGNDRLYENVVRREMRVKPGALYSQSDLVRTLRELAQLKQFDEEKIYNGVDLQPDVENGTVDLEFNLETKSSDQVEFSAGYGQSGIVLSVGLTFSNFAIQNLFKPETYRIVPQGEGQTLSLKAQANGVYYQNYSLSFYEPWLGGKRPNSLSVSLFYAVQTGLSERWYNNMSNMNNYYSNYYNGYNGYGGYGGYGGGYGGYGGSYNNGYESEYDKNVYMRTFGGSVGYGTRLKWPDDYFTFYADLSYRRYSLKNWYSDYYGFETGESNDIAIGLNLSRNSIDNPIYTRSGSSVTMSVNATLPYSLFYPDKDYSSMSVVERSKWVEYHKWKLSAKFFTPLTRDRKLVLMTRAEYGFLGYYNKNKRSQFGKYMVGGDGMSGYVTPGTDMIAMRGYSIGSLTPFTGDGYYGYNGNLYTKLTLELRYPLLLNQSTNIWALAFLEAGNAWENFVDFSPFDLKRSAGVGVRVYLPMFGLLGVDWAYGFDKDRMGAQGGSQFHFVLGQEF